MYPKMGVNINKTRTEFRRHTWIQIAISFRQQEEFLALSNVIMFSSVVDAICETEDC